MVISGSTQRGRTAQFSAGSHRSSGKRLRLTRIHLPEDQTNLAPCRRLDKSSSGTVETLASLIPLLRADVPVVSMRSIGCLRMGMRTLISHMQVRTAAELNDSFRLGTDIQLESIAGSFRPIADFRRANLATGKQSLNVKVNGCRRCPIRVQLNPVPPESSLRLGSRGQPRHAGQAHALDTECQHYGTCGSRTRPRHCHASTG